MISNKNIFLILSAFALNMVSDVNAMEDQKNVQIARTNTAAFSLSAAEIEKIYNVFDIVQAADRAIERIRVKLQLLFNGKYNDLRDKYDTLFNSLLGASLKSIAAGDNKFETTASQLLEEVKELPKHVTEQDCISFPRHALINSSNILCRYNLDNDATLFNDLLQRLKIEVDKIIMEGLKGKRTFANKYTLLVNLFQECRGKYPHHFVMGCDRDSGRMSHRILDKLLTEGQITLDDCINNYIITPYGEKHDIRITEFFKKTNFLGLITNFIDHLKSFTKKKADFLGNHNNNAEFGNSNILVGVCDNLKRMNEAFRERELRDSNVRYLVGFFIIWLRDINKVMDALEGSYQELNIANCRDRTIWEALEALQAEARFLDASAFKFIIQCAKLPGKDDYDRINSWNKLRDFV